MLEEAHTLALNGENVLFLQPTKDLCNQSVKDLAGLTLVAHQLIHGDTVKGPVGELSKMSAKGFSSGGIVFSTHEAFVRTKFFAEKIPWTLFIDEEINPLVSFRGLVSQIHHHITKYVNLQAMDGTYIRAFVTNDTHLRALAEGRIGDDAVTEKLGPLANCLLSNHWDTFFHEEQFRKLVGGSGRAITAFSILKPSLVKNFKSVTMAGAFFEETLLYKLWSKQCVKFVKSPLRLRYSQHDNSDLITIYDAIDDDWSSTLRKKENNRIFNEIVKAIKKETQGGKDLLWAANECVPDTLFQAENRLPHSPHGLNSFQHFDDVAFLSARLPTPAQFKFLEEQGITSEEVRTWSYYHSIYQAVLRGSIRNPKNLNQKKVFVADKGARDWLLKKPFPNAKHVRLNVDVGCAPLKGKPGREKLYASGSARVAAWREKNWLKEIEAEKANCPGLVPSHIEIAKNECNENTLLGENVTLQFFCSVWPKVDSNKLIGNVFYNNEREFIEQLRSWHKQSYAEKEDNRLLSPCLFAPPYYPNQRRRLVDVAYARGIFLDVEDGDLTLEDFARINPALTFYGWNSFRSTKEKPRFRIYIPTSTIIRSADDYETIAKEIVATVIDAGFTYKKQNRRFPNRKAHGIDGSKLNAASLFFRPCQAKDPKASFFEIFEDGGRKPLDPEEWLDKARERETRHPKPVQPLINLRSSVDQAMVTAARRHWRSVCHIEKQGNTEFFKLGLKLASAGMNEEQIREVLNEEWPYARHPHERRSGVEWVIRSLRRYGHLQARITEDA
ncbi:hypothetical protein C4E04_19175 [Microvirga sp. 17 mud 1-3]|nr:hypothetical protein C4E04_19175 [Microvirga sp. 17 mud 1-3]